MIRRPNQDKETVYNHKEHKIKKSEASECERAWEEKYEEFITLIWAHILGSANQKKEKQRISKKSLKQNVHSLDNPNFIPSDTLQPHDAEAVNCLSKNVPNCGSAIFFSFNKVIRYNEYRTFSWKKSSPFFSSK